MDHLKEFAERAGLSVADYLAIAQQSSEQGKLSVPIKASIGDNICPHRSPQPDRVGTCDLCGNRGQPFDVYNCELHGDCSLTRFHSRVKSCLACADRPNIVNSESSAPSAADDTPSLTIEVVVGITTAPRRVSYLSQCVASVFSAGFQDVRLFAEPNTDVSGCRTAMIVQRESRLGCWHNWLEMSRELLATTDAPIIATVQDDILMSSNAGLRLQELWPREVRRIGFVSGYSAAHYQKKFAVHDASGHPLGYFPDQKAATRYTKQRKHNGKSLTIKTHEVTAPIHRVQTRSLWGACCLFWPRESLARVVEHRIAHNWKGAGKQSVPTDRVANSDTAIGKICNTLKLEMRFINPSITQHIGAASTLAHGGLGGRRQALRVESDLPANQSGGKTACKNCG